MAAYWFRDFTKEERDTLAKSGDAMPDGSYPIKTTKDLTNAVTAIGRAKPGERAAVKRHIIKRAKALGKTDLLPADWSGSTKKENREFAGEPGGGDLHVPAIVKSVARRTKAYQSRLYSLMSGRFTKEELDKFKKQARAHAGGKTKAALRAAGGRYAEGEIDDVLDETLELEGEPNTGLWIALRVPIGVASQLAVIENGELPEDLHVTLAVMGDASEYDTMDLAKMLVSIEDCVRWSPPLSGAISGVGRFDNNDQEDPQDVIYASVDVPGLSGLRERIVNRLQGSKIQVDNTHGFDPHITLAYVPEDLATPDLELGGIPVRFDSVCVYIGENETEIALGGEGGYCCGGACACSETGQHELAELCAGRHKARLFVELPAPLEFKEKLPEWIPYLPKPGRYMSPRYGEILITKERNANFVKNFNAGVYQEKLPIDAEHELSLSGACGWIVKMRQNSDGSADAKTDWTPRGKKLVESGQYRYISPAFFDKWTDPATEKEYSDVAYGAALTIRPFFKEKNLRPLLASEKGLSEGELDGESFKFAELKNYNSEHAYTEDATGETTSEGNRMAVTKEQLETARALVKAYDAKQKTCSEDEIKAARAIVAEADASAGEKKFSDAELAAAVEAGKKEAAEAARKEVEEANGKKLTEAEQQNKQMSDRIASLEKDARQKRFTEQATAFVGNRNYHVEMMEFIATTEPKGEESDRFKNYVQNAKAMAEQAKTGKLFEEKGSSTTGDAAGDPVASVEAMAKTFREQDKELSAADAMQKVMRENPALYEEYRTATTRLVG